MTDKSISGNYLVLTGIYMSLLLMGMINGVKLCQIGSFKFDGGLLPYTATFLLIDIVREVYGRPLAIKMVMGGFFALVMTFITNYLTILLPAAPEWQFSHEYQTVIGQGYRIAAAALASFVVTQTLDLSIFAWVRKKTQGRHLWLRYLVSSIGGGGLDAFIFTFIAFYGVFPVADVMLSAWIVRTVFAVCDTPVVYFGVWLVRRLDHREFRTNGFATA